ncbi:MAG: hypothetical protein AAGD32_05165 [Planctomycetota bacterium]
MDYDKDNSAARLLSILESAQKSRARNVSDMLSEVFPQQATDELGVLKVLAQLFSLQIKVQEDVRALENANPDRLLKRHERVTDLFKRLNPDAGWEGLRGSINEAMLDGLEHCADAIDRESPIDRIAADDLVELRAQIHTVRELVIRSSLSSSTKTALVKMLAQIDLAIVDYSITGLDGMAQALEQAAGIIALDENSRKEADENGDAGFEVWKVVSRGCELVRTAASATRLGGWVKFLPLVADEGSQKLLSE